MSGIYQLGLSLFSIYCIPGYDMPAGNNKAFLNGKALVYYFPGGIYHSRMVHASQEYAKIPYIREWHRAYS
jgi:hypothetical protein